MDLEVARADLRRTRIVPGRPLSQELGADRVLCRIESFALTASNVTYAVTGDELGYWDCFPATEEDGGVPAWGYGEVVTSAHPGIGQGERSLASGRCPATCYSSRWTWVRAALSTAPGIAPAVSDLQPIPASRLAGGRGSRSA